MVVIISRYNKEIPEKNPKIQYKGFYYVEPFESDMEIENPITFLDEGELFINGDMVVRGSVRLEGNLYIVGRMFINGREVNFNG